MGQVTWRAPDELVRRIQNLAHAEGTSMNELINRVLTLATDSDEVDPHSVRLRTRLRAAGMLADGSSARGTRPASVELARARVAAGEGVPLSDVVSTMRE